MSKVVLVVDDSESIRKFVAFSLRAMGYSVITARDGLEALEKLLRAHVDLVITDLNMPKLDGFGLVRAIRQDSEQGTVPIIILSSLTSQQEMDQGRLLGADAFLTKPFDPKRIQYEVSKYL